MHRILRVQDPNSRKWLPHLIFPFNRMAGVLAALLLAAVMGAVLGLPYAPVRLRLEYMPSPLYGLTLPLFASCTGQSLDKSHGNL